MTSVGLLYFVGKDENSICELTKALARFRQRLGYAPEVIYVGSAIRLDNTNGLEVRPIEPVAMKRYFLLR